MTPEALKLFCVDLRVTVSTGDGALSSSETGGTTRAAGGATSEGEVPAIDADDQAALDRAEHFQIRWRDGTSVTIGAAEFGSVMRVAPLLAQKLADAAGRVVEV